MAKKIKLTEDQFNGLFKNLVEQVLNKDKWGRDEFVNGKPSLFYGFDAKTKTWVQGPCKGIKNNNDACRKKLGLKTRSQMSAKEEALAYQPKTSKNTPWPIQVNYYRPLDEKFPTGHVEARSVREPQYQINANPIRNNYIEALTSNPKTKNFWNMPIKADKPQNASSIYVYLTDKEYGQFKKNAGKINLDLGYLADKYAQSVKSPTEGINNYNVLTQNCADGVSRALGAVPGNWDSTTKNIIIGAATLISPILGAGVAYLNSKLETKVPIDVFNKIKEIYKGRFTYAHK